MHEDKDTSGPSNQKHEEALFKGIGDPDEDIHGIRRPRFIANMLYTAFWTLFYLTSIALFVSCAKHG